MIVLLALGLLPTPIVLDWFVHQPREAQAATTSVNTWPPINDLAPPQPEVTSFVGEPHELLAAQGLLPAYPIVSSAIQPPALPAVQFSETQRSQLLADLTASLGAGEAQRVLSQADRAPEPAPSLLERDFAPPPVPDPFATQPLHVDFRRPR